MYSQMCQKLYVLELTHRARRSSPYPSIRRSLVTMTPLLIQAYEDNTTTMTVTMMTLREGELPTDQDSTSVSKYTHQTMMTTGSLPQLSQTAKALHRAVNGSPRGTRNAMTMRLLRGNHNAPV